MPERGPCDVCTAAGHATTAVSCPPRDVHVPARLRGVRYASVRPAPASAATRSTANAYPCTPQPAMTPSARSET